jgi:hypothetical protein
LFREGVGSGDVRLIGSHRAGSPFPPWLADFLVPATFSLGRDLVLAIRE